MDIRYLTVATALAALGLGAGVAWLGRSMPAQQPVQATVLDRPRPLPEFELLDENAARIDRETFVGQWDVLFFGFTHCPDICPTTLAVVAAAMTELADIPPAALPRVWLVSVDPDRDTPQVLAGYVRFFDDRFRGATGQAKQIDRFASGVGAAYTIDPGDTDGDYTVSHTAALFVVDPEARLAAVMSGPHDHRTIAHDLRVIIGDMR